MREKLLVIDDEEILTKTFARLLEKKGYEVFVASRSEDAVAMAEEIDFNMILCDMRMPGQNGVEIIRRINSLRAGQGKNSIPIIFLTGYADEKLEGEAQKLNPIAYILKPFDAFHLLDVIGSNLSA